VTWLSVTFIWDDVPVPESANRNVVVFLIMTALAVMSAPLATLILGIPDRAQVEPSPASESPTTGGSLGEQPPGEDGPPPKPTKATDFVVASFNVLGGSHTAADGKEPEMASGIKRVRRAVDLLDQAQVDVVGLQELQRPMATEFESVAGSDWQLFHAKADTENAIAWRRTTWTMLKTQTVGVPYFNGTRRPMPVVLLRHNPSGAAVWLINVHNPANTKRFPDQEDFRAAAARIERQLVRKLARGGRPVILMGDFNQHAEAFCFFTDSGTLQSATGDVRQPDRKQEANCPEPKFGGVEPIFGTQDLAFSSWNVRDDDPVDVTSDHPLVTASVRFR